MKNLSLLLVVSLICFISHSEDINKTYRFDQPSVLRNGDFQSVRFSNTLLTGVTGEPALPYKDIRLLLPPGEEAVAVSLRYDDEVVLEGSYRLYPMQASRPVSEGTSGNFILNTSIYGSSDPYPAEQLGRYSTHFLNGHSILLGTFTPVKYIPSSGKLSYYRTVTVEVTTRRTDRSSKALENIGPARYRTVVSNFVENSECLANYPVRNSRDEGYQILVITPQQFVADFDEYISLYAIRGMKAVIATTESITLTMQGADLQEKIRNFIIQEYQENGVEYVMLGGDVEHIPFRGFYCYVDSGSGYEDINIPADLYYSALDGNWNTDGDPRWGEDGEDDLLPDVSVTRWPFSNQLQFQKLMHKTTLYQDSPVTGELQRPLIAGEYLWSDPLTYGCDYLDLLIGHHEDNGYTTDGIPETDDIFFLCDEESDWSKWDLIDAVNEGRNFIHHSGHANTTYTMRLDISDVNNENFNQVNGINHNYTLVYTHGCICGAFDYNDCIGEAMVLINNFAVAGAFNSRYGWFNEGQTEGPSAHLHREFVDALYDQKLNRIGETHKISKINTSPWVTASGQWEEGALRWCFYDCNIFGDPALAVWTAEPMPIDVQYPGEIIVGATSFSVTVTSNGLPAEGLMCVIMSGGEMAGTCETGPDGKAVIQIPGGFSGDDAELVVSGYMCTPHHYPLSVQVGIDPLTTLSGVLAYPVPFNSELAVRFFTEIPAEYEVSFSLADGRLIEKRAFQASGHQGVLNVDASGWPTGVIFMQVRSEQGTITRKIIHLSK